MKNYFFLFLYLNIFWSFNVYSQKEISLNGEWQVVFDKENKENKLKWHTEEEFYNLSDIRNINVPSSLEEIEQDYEGFAFYGKKFKVPINLKNKIVRAKFGAVNYVAEVWLNNICIGRNEGGYGPFDLRIDDVLKFDEENFLSLRVITPIISQDL